MTTHLRLEYAVDKSQAAGRYREIRYRYQEIGVMSSGMHADEQRVYQIRVEGKLNERWSVWFEEMAMGFDRASDDTPVTTLTGAVADQARLRGILSKLWDLNLTLVSVARIETREIEPGHGQAER
jgi:hypothetical protein